MARVRSFYIVVAGLLAWAGLFLQAAITFPYLLHHGLSWFDTIQRFFAFFSNWTALLAAISYVALFFHPNEPVKSFWARPPVVAGIALSLFFVNVVFALLLQHLRHVTIWPMIALFAVHYVTPWLYILCWLIFIPKGTLRWSHISWWLIYPIVYFIYTLIQGLRYLIYPYPFVDVTKLGYPAVLLNGAILLALFALAGLLLVVLDRNWPFDRLRPRR